MPTIQKEPFKWLAPPSPPQDRLAVYRFFDGAITAQDADKVSYAKGKPPLVKTFLLEHVSSNGRATPKHPKEIFTKLGATVVMIDDDFMSLSFPSDEDNSKLATVGFIEKFNERFFAYYTCEGAQGANRRVKNWVRAPDLDHAWFSSLLLNSIWEKDVSKRDPRFYSKLTFCHESVFDMPEDYFSEPEDEADAVPGSEDYDFETAQDNGNSQDDREEIERRKARIEMGDRIGKLNDALVGKKIRDAYDPLNALYALRIPSRTCHNGHDLKQNGQLVNRTGDFLDHRNTVVHLYNIYNTVLNRTEESAWHDLDKSAALSGNGSTIKGAPLIVKFSEKLTKSVFDRWIQMAFYKKNVFKLWGNPIVLGPTKIHVYGADRHLWQPINMEITESGLVAMLPQGTCGNTFHRLVSNIQQFVSPKITAWLGSRRFEDVTSDWELSAEGGNEH